MQIVEMVLGLLPGFAWLFFYLEEDRHPEPKKLIAKTFIFGIGFAFIALWVEILLISALKSAGIGKLAIFSLFVFALIEEFVKFAAAYLSIHKNPAFDEPTDAMIYMVTAALGFATVENLGAIGSISLSANHTAILSNVFANISLRFVGATLLHSLTSAILGYCWAMGIRNFGKKWYIVLGLAAATILHTLFNYLIINLGNVIYALVFLVIIAFFVLNDFEKLKRRAL
jgi:RsiW-degrading membrane proteinase PrsW (M82 family)